MATLDGLLSSLSPNADLRGRQFERVAKWFLLNDPVQKAQFREVWLWNEWADADGPDIGIDLVAERKDRSLVAVQVKCFAAEYQVPKREIDSFLSASSQERFAERLLVATCDLGRNARRTVEAQQKPVHTLLRSDLEHSPVSWPASPTRLRPWTPTPRRPRRHQRRAIQDVVKGFERGDRGQLIMACGTGKTLTCLWISEALDARRTLILVPSLSLLAQTVREWKFSDSRGFEFLAVCSDQTVVDEDAMVAHTAELPFTGVTTDPDRIARFLRGRGPRVLLSTYQSSPRVAEAQALPRVPWFDLAVADEAHRCAGKVDDAFGSILDATRIRARRRLFATATPRIASGRLKRAAADYDFEVSSMDDEAVFGKVFHTLTFGEAIHQDLLSDYQVVVMFVDDEEVRDYVERGVFVQTDDGAVRDARTLGAQIGLVKAMRRFRLHRMVTFHSRVNLAARFASTLPAVLDWMPKSERPVGKIWTAHVSGLMPSGQRDRLLRYLAGASGSERAILSNARCLTEGVDVPTLDGIAFVDPRRSQVDVVQAVGRAIRKAEDKGIGTVLLPVFLPPDAVVDEALTASVLGPVVQVLRALRDHDERLAHELDELRTELGRRGSIDRLPTRIRVDAPVMVGTDFIRAIDARIIELASPSWPFWLGLLESYVEREGHCRPPSHYREREYALGDWVITQRVNRARLSNERVEALEAVPGWTWDARESRWDRHFRALEAFVSREGHARVPSDHVEAGVTIGRWVMKQRSRRGAMRSDYVKRLEALPGWTWNAKDKWNDYFVALEHYTAREGHSRVPVGHIEDDLRLGSWASAQRSLHRQDELQGDRASMLASLPAWSWDPIGERQDSALASLELFVSREGHARVPLHHVEDGFPLGRWVSRRRQEYRRDELTSEQVATLEGFDGWSWGVNETSWQRGYDMLRGYVGREGTSVVPQSQCEGDYPIGKWASTQRRSHSRGRLTDRRTRLLQDLPGWSWNLRDDSWTRGLAAFQEFVADNGHSRVSGKFVSPDGVPLGTWMQEQRQRLGKGLLSNERQRQIDAIDASWAMDHQEARWLIGLQHLREYAGAESTTEVPAKYVASDGFLLGKWTHRQRDFFKEGKLSGERIARLEALPGWRWKSRRSGADVRSVGAHG